MSSMLLTLPGSRPVFDHDMAEAVAAIHEVTQVVPLEALRGCTQFQPVQVATAIKFLRLCGKTQTLNYGDTFLKHPIERWGRCRGLAPYVSAADVTVAAIWCEFRVVWDERGHVDIGAVKKDVRRLDVDYECKPMRGY